VKSRLLNAFCAGVLLTGFAVESRAAFVTYTNQSDFQSAAGDLTVEDFESGLWLPGTKTQPVVNLGVSWTAGNELGATSAVFFSPFQAISSIDGSPEDSNDLITADLSGAVTAVGGYVYLGFTTGGVTLTAFDSSSVIIGNVTSAASSGWEFIGLISDTAIDVAQFESTSPPTSDDFALDDFQWSSAVPIPATVYLFASGLLGLIGLAKKWKA